MGFWTDAPTQENEISAMMAYDWKRITQLIELGGKGIYYYVNANGWLIRPCDWSQPLDSSLIVNLRLVNQKFKGLITGWKCDVCL